MTLAAQTTALSPRIANYDMNITLDVENKKLQGKTKLVWKNPGTTKVGELQFHLYYNAFKNSESTFFKESDGIPGFFRGPLVDDGGWSYSRIESMKDQHGNDLMKGMSYIQPDDDNQDDETVLRVMLPDSVEGGDSILVEFDWVAKIPKSMVRTGYNQDFYFFAQWFPKVGVFETAGTRYATTDQWNTHQYHSNGEYYSDFGNYRVSMTVPSDFVIGSSGSIIDQNMNGDMQTWTFVVDDVIDFTWTASPHFQVLKDHWRDVELTLLTYPGHEHFAPRYFETVKNSFEYLDKHVGKYPYKTLTMVDPPIHGLFTGGMEYPTLITSISFCFLPQGFKSVETLVTHEFIHQYFMQMVATHEQEEPWMDEGITTYYEGRILDHYATSETSFVDFWGIEVGNSAYNRYEFFNSENPKIANHTYKARDYKHGGYSPIAYNKTAVWLVTLERMIGRETFDLAMKEYFKNWKFKHPNRENFIDVFNRVVKEQHGDKFGQNLNGFFDQVLFGSDVCDYSVASIQNFPLRNKEGIFDQKKSDKDGRQVRSRLVLNRLGEIKLPVEIKITFDDGQTLWESWDGIARSYEFNYYEDRQIINAELDPERKIWIDKNFLNNSRTSENQSRGIRNYWLRTFTTAQNVLESLSLII